MRAQNKIMDTREGYAIIFNCNGNKIASFLHAFSNTVEKGASRQKSQPKPENS
jgi:hypothetical protein